MFRYDSPFMRFCSNLSDFVFLNVLAVICSIPIITIGATATALHDAIYRLDLGEGHVYASFFKTFASNFKKATLLWLIFLPVTVLLMVGALLLLTGALGSTVLPGIVCLLLFLWLLGMSWFFPLQSRSETTVMETFRSCFSYVLAFPLRSVIMALLNAIPLVCIVSPNLLSLMGMPLVCFYFSIAAFITLKLLKKPFAHFEEEEEEAFEE